MTKAIEKTAPSWEEALALFHPARDHHARLVNAAQAAAAELELAERDLVKHQRRRERAEKDLAESTAETVLKGGTLDRETHRERIVDAGMGVIEAQAKIPVAREKAAAAEAAVREGEYAWHNAVHAPCEVIKESALAGIRAHYVAMAEPLAQLIAMSKLREKLIGRQPQFDPSRFLPIGGRELAKAISDSIPPRVAPVELAMPALNKRAAEIVAKLERELKTADAEELA